MTLLITFTVYTLTPRGSFSQKYSGTDEEAANKAYARLEARNLPRCLNRVENGLAKRIKGEGIAE